jgi:NAD(P)-dependent dehydrogenase (short-subunit alcohol dehydrogenase family)
MPRARDGLQGTVAIITGAGSGMGPAMATRLAAEGASVVAADSRAERLDAAVTAIAADGVGRSLTRTDGRFRDASAHRGDLEERSRVASLRTASRFRRLR